MNKLFAILTAFVALSAATSWAAEAMEQSRFGGLTDVGRRKDAGPTQYSFLDSPEVGRRKDAGVTEYSVGGDPTGARRRKDAGP